MVTDRCIRGTSEGSPDGASAIAGAVSLRAVVAPTYAFVISFLFMIGYGVHRFLNEMLRTDTEPVAFNMTLSQNISIAVFVVAVLLGILILLREGMRKANGVPAAANLR